MKKTMAIFVLTAMVLCTLPVQGEPLTTDDFEAGYANWSITGGTAGTTYMSEPTTGHDGETTNALKIAPAANTDTVTARSQNMTVDAGALYEVTLYLNLTAIDAEATGVKMSVYDAANDTLLTRTTAPYATVNYTSETGYFKLADEGWRKMMVIIPKTSIATSVYAQIEVNGAITAYFDDFCLYKSDTHVINGDFEGFADDYAPAWWTGNTNVAGYFKEDGSRLMDDGTGNHYLRMKGTGSHAYAYQMDAFENMVVGNKYKITLDYYADRAGMTCMWVRAGGADSYGAYYLYVPTRKVWNRAHTYYIIAENGWESIMFQQNYSASYATEEGRIDNVRYELVETKKEITFASANELNEQNEVIGCRITATYTDTNAPLTKTVLTNPAAATQTVNQYTTDPVTLVMAVYSMVDGVPCLQDVLLKTEMNTHYGLTMKSSNYWGAYAPHHGKAPLTVENSLIIPTDSAYTVKAFAWKDLTTISPFATAKYTAA